MYAHTNTSTGKPLMYYNPATDRALQTLEQKAEENRKIIQKLTPAAPNAIVWDVAQGRWVPNKEAALIPA